LLNAIAICRVIWWSISERIYVGDSWVQILGSKLKDLKCCRRCCSLTFILLKCWMYRNLYKLQLQIQALPSIAKEVIEVLDILLRWFVLQFCQSNTTYLLKVWFIIVYFLISISLFSFLLEMYGVGCNFIRFNCTVARISSRASWHLEGWGVLSDRIWNGGVSSIPSREG